MAITRTLHVLIAGGGLSGLCLAQGLLKAGHRVDVFERDADPRRSGYYLNINADGGEALRDCLPGDLFDLYRATSRTTPDRSGSIVLDDQLNELSSQPHLGPPNEGPDRHTGVNRRTLREILLAGLGDSFHAGLGVESYDEDVDGVTVRLSDGSIARGDVLVGADGIRSVVRGQKLPEVDVVEAGIHGLGVYGRTPLTPELRAVMPHILFQGVIIAADHLGRVRSSPSSNHGIGPTQPAQAWSRRSSSTRSTTTLWSAAASRRARSCRDHASGRMSRRRCCGRRC